MHDAQRHMNYGAVFYFGPYKYMLASGLLKGALGFDAARLGSIIYES